MIAQLPEIEDTPWGKELKELWTAEARAAQAEARAAQAEALRRMIQRRDEDLRHYEEMLRQGVLSDAAYHDLTARAEKELQECRAHLAETENGAK